MILKTKDFKEAANKILLASDSDKNVTCLELVTKESNLYLNVTNKEFYVSVKFPLAEPIAFRAVVNADLFLKLVSALTTEEFSLDIVDNYVLMKAGKCEYKIPMIYVNEDLLTLPVITLQNKTVEMPIKLDILQSILNINSKELLKVKNIDVNELQKLYFIDENGCFTFTTGACLNAFHLDKPIKILLNDRIVKLFKLFKTDVIFALAKDSDTTGNIVTKVSFIADDVYVAALITSDDKLINGMEGPCNMTKNYISEKYDYSLALSTAELSSAIQRLMLFTKQSDSSTTNTYMPIDAKIVDNAITLSDKYGNSETVSAKNELANKTEYDFKFNMNDLKLVLDSTKTDTITFNCGNHRSIFLSRGTVYNIIPEMVR